ncbi:MAG: hypothetical protein NTV22_18940 [bacterium]|nr:hypothetical protein [bacterium]
MDNLMILVTAGALGAIGAIGALYLTSRLGRIRLARPSTVAVRPTSIKFTGEQDGPRERMLKAALVTRFQADSMVKRAYLARLDIGEGFTVGLCIKANPLPDLSYPEKISELFMKVMGPGGYLHILFLTDDQEIEIRRVCQSFYESTPSSA